MKMYVLVLPAVLAFACTVPPQKAPVAVAAVAERATDPAEPAAEVEMSPPYDPAWDALPSDEGLSAYEQRNDPMHKHTYEEAANRAAIQQSQDAAFYAAIRVMPPHPGRGGWIRTAEQGCLAARMGISENSKPLRRRSGKGTQGELTQDHHGIMNVVQNNVKLGDGWLHVMKRLSPHVGKVKEPNRPRQKWTSTLPCEGDEKPDGWDDDKWAGDWEVARKYWPQFRDEVVRVWVGDLVEYMPGLAIAWGCKQSSKRRWCMDPVTARQRGLCELREYGQLNGFWARPGRGCGRPHPGNKASPVAMLDAKVAAGH